MKRPDLGLEGLSEVSGIPNPNPIPYTDLTAAMVLWNEAERLPRLLEVLHPVFEHTTIVVQASTDDTLDIALAARRTGDSVVIDEHRGTGDASMPKVLSNVRTDWVFVVAGDELPDDTLLRSLWTAGWWAEQERIDGLWIDFESTIDGVPAQIDSAHLRMFKTALRWPNTMHSRVTPNVDGYWPFGKLHHDRSLDEMIVDYLRYLSMSGQDAGWLAHNKLMIRDACTGVAEVKGWDYVQSFPWWPEAREAAF